MNINTSFYKSLLLIIGIAIISLPVYFRFFPNKLIIRRKEISIEKSRFPPIGGFYHFAIVGPNWRRILNEQMLLVNRSGLFNESSNIYVTGLGKIEDNKTAYDLFTHSKFVYGYDTRTQLYEFPTLKKLEKFCLHNNKSLVWYAHSKGASYPNDFVAGWRAVMNYFVLDNWQLCYELLSSTNYTTCGAILTFDSFRKPGWNTYYAGNMWWAKCSHVNRLARIETIDQNDRYLAELYVTSEPDIGHFNCLFINLHLPIIFNKQNASCTKNHPLWWVR
jgi:hypothetical protein